MSLVLDPKKVVAGAVVIVVEQWRVFAKTLLFPSLLYCVVDLAQRFEPTPAVVAVTLLLGIGLQTVIAVTTHRLVLLGPGSVPEWGLRSWTKRESLFLLYLFGLVLISMPTAVLQLIPVIGWLAMMAGMAWLASRLSLVFPAVAVEQDISFRCAWSMSAKHQWPLLITVVVFPAILSIPIVLLARVPYASLASSLLAAAATVLTIAALSLAYREVAHLEQHS